MHLIHKFLVVLALAIGLGVVASVSAMAGEMEFTDRAAFDNAVRAMCGKSIVILGEASHGDGHSDTFKVALIKRLILQCRFNGVLFESSVYEFDPISQKVRNRQPVSPYLIAAAVGGLWKFDREVQPLFDFLAHEINRGEITMGGLDFQAGGYQQPYSNDVMIKELTSHLPTERRDFCRALYHSRIYEDVPPDGTTDAARVDSLRSCWRDIGSNITGTAGGDAKTRAEERRELANLDAWLASDGINQDGRIRSRDRMMADNASAFIDHLAKPAKVIIWTANGHAAHDTSLLIDYHSSDNLGTALSRRYGSKVFSLAITARSGKYRWSQGTDKAIPIPPPGALESLDDGGNPNTSTFIGPHALMRAGMCLASIFGHTYMRGKWVSAFDGVVVLNAEYPPHSTRPQSN